MDIPHNSIVIPAMAWENLSNFSTGINLNPEIVNKTIDSIVTIVVIANVNVTSTNEITLLFAAGYIRTGIRDSHGPKTKIINRIQGVNFWSFSVCT